MESPGLIVSKSPWDVYAKGAEQLLLLNKNIHAMKPEELKDWAYARAEIHWNIIFDKVRLLWEKSERKMGEWSDIDSDMGLQMCRHGLDFHIEEVLRCYGYDNIDASYSFSSQMQYVEDEERPISKLKQYLFKSVTHTDCNFLVF